MNPSTEQDVPPPKGIPRPPPRREILPTAERLACVARVSLQCGRLSASLVSTHTALLSGHWPEFASPTPTVPEPTLPYPYGTRTHPPLPPRYPNPARLCLRLSS